VMAAFIGARYELLWMDGVMTVGVAALIGWSAWTTLAQTISPLLGEQPPDAMLRKIETLALSFPRVMGVHEIMVHRYGYTLVISLHVEAPLDDALRLHEVSQAIETRIERHFPAHVVVHIDPVNPNHPHYAAVQKIVEEITAQYDWVTTYHDLRLLGDMPFTAECDVVPEGTISEADVDALREQVQTRLSEQFPDAVVLIRVDAPYFERSVCTPGQSEKEKEKL